MKTHGVHLLTEAVSRVKSDVETTKLVDINRDRDQVLLIPLCGHSASVIEAVGQTMDTGRRGEPEVAIVGSILGEAFAMNVSLNDELKEFVRRKIEKGQYQSEEAVIEAALRQLRNQEGEVRKTGSALDAFIDHEFVEYCAREADDSVTLEEVLEATSTIKQSMARTIIEEERADRF